MGTPLAAPDISALLRTGHLCFAPTAVCRHAVEAAAKEGLVTVAARLDADTTRRIRARVEIEHHGNSKAVWVLIGAERGSEGESRGRFPDAAFP